MEEILQSLPDPMKLNQSVWFIFVLVLVLLFILNRYLFKPVVAILNEREEKIKEGLIIRESSLKTIEDSQDAYNRRLTEARKNAYSKRLEILKEAQGSFDKAVKESKAQTSASIKTAMTELESQVEQVKTQLKGEAEMLSEKILLSVLNKKSIS